MRLKTSTSQLGQALPSQRYKPFLPRKDKYLPLASPWHDATISGLIAANVNAPLRMRYGSLRDIVLCATVALADGRVIRTGRPIVKNVAGYDLTKIFIGSHGTLGLLTDVTLKFFARPRAKRSLLVPAETLHDALNWAKVLLPLALTASAVLVYKDDTTSSTYTLLYTAEGLVEDVQAELNQVRDVLLSVGVPEVHEVEMTGTNVWTQMLATGTVVRVGVAAKDLSTYMQENTVHISESAFLADISSGCLYAIKTIGSSNEIQEWISSLRQPALFYEGYAAVMNLAENMPEIDRWGYRPQALDVMKRLKQRWDPADILQGEGSYLDTARERS